MENTEMHVNCSWNFVLPASTSDPSGLRDCYADLYKIIYKSEVPLPPPFFKYRELQYSYTAILLWLLLPTAFKLFLRYFALCFIHYSQMLWYPILWQVALTASVYPSCLFSVVALLHFLWGINTIKHPLKFRTKCSGQDPSFIFLICRTKLVKQPPKGHCEN